MISMRMKHEFEVYTLLEMPDSLGRLIRGFLLLLLLCTTITTNVFNNIVPSGHTVGIFMCVCVCVHVYMCIHIYIYIYMFYPIYLHICHICYIYIYIYICSSCG